MAALARDVNERCREVLAMEALPRSEEALVRCLYGLEFKFDVDSFAEAARRHLCVSHFPIGIGIGDRPAATAASASAATGAPAASAVPAFSAPANSVASSMAAARSGSGALFSSASAGGYAPLPATVRTVNVLSAPVVVSGARTTPSIRALQVQTASAVRLQSARGDTLVVQAGAGVPGVIVPGNPIVRVMPGVPVSASLQHLSTGGTLSGIRTTGHTTSGPPPSVASTSSTTITPPTGTAIVRSAPQEHSGTGPSVGQSSSTRASEESGRESLPNLNLYPRGTGTTAHTEVKQEVQLLVLSRINLGF